MERKEHLVDQFVEEVHAEHEKYMLGMLVFMPKHEKYIESKSSNS